MMHCWGREEDDLTRKIFNISNLLGMIAIAAMIAAIVAVESEMYIMAIVLLAVFAGCAYFAMKEDGQIK